MQFNGRNYLLPVDAKLDEEEDVNRFRLLPVDDLVELLGQTRGLPLLILDACRNNPIERDFKNKVASTLPNGFRDVAQSRGIVRIEQSNGLIVVYATSPNKVASDGAGRNSPFTASFLKFIGAPDAEIRLALSQVQRDVVRTTAQSQRPEISLLYTGPDVYLNLRGVRP